MLWKLIYPSLGVSQTFDLLLTNWFKLNNGDQTEICVTNVYLLFLFRFGQLLTIFKGIVSE